MIDQSNAPARIVSDESSFDVPDYGLDPADNAIAHEIANFDPVNDVRGPVTFDGGWATIIPAQVPLTSLPPRIAEPIKAELASASPERRPALEAKLIAEALYSNSLQLRVSAGPGAGANPYQIESFAQAKERQDLENEAWSLRAELADVARWDNVADPKTGKQQPVAVERVQGHPRKLKEGRLNEIERKLEALKIEGPRRLKKAMQEAVEAHKAKQQQIADEAEARRRAEQIVREDRINDRAAVRARMLKGSIG